MEQHASPFFHSVPGWDVAAYLRIKDKSVVNGRDWEVTWQVSYLKVYVGIDMAKDRFDYCAMDDSLNILCRGSNRENRNERFSELSDLIIKLKSTSNMMKIGMESTGIYHIPLYNHLRTHGFPVRILNGLEVRGMKKSRVR